LFWTGEQLSRSAAERGLRGLDEKGYIVRETAPGRKGLYVFHIQKYLATAGADEGKVLTFFKK
jgi:hypothetical protein